MAERVDALAPFAPADVTLTGFLGERVAANEAHLLAVDLEPLLAGFRHRPGVHPWIGEHIGKWLHAASLAWQHNGDPRLRSRIDEAVGALLETQEPDGYLGTYAPGRRLSGDTGADWDVWVHKYVLIGLLAAHAATGNAEALAGARRVGDLLVTTFGSDADGGRRLLAAGWHAGMAATSVLEPVVLLYRATGDERYLDFAHRIVAAWDLPGGPRVVAALRETGQVAQVGNGKAYEMLSNLVGLAELARATSDEELIPPLVAGWTDIVTHHRYVTGGASVAEHFGLPDRLPNPMSPNVAETCVTVTWLQLNQQLLRLTGEARFADELERTAYNHLLAAQRPDGMQWCYYTALAGTKPYGPGISCCVSSGPRGVAMLPTMAYGRAPDGEVAVALLEPSTVVLDAGAAGLGAADPTWLTLESAVPFAGDVTVRIDGPARNAERVRIRAPWWTDDTADDGWWRSSLSTSRGDASWTVQLATGVRRIAGTHDNRGKVALGLGPLVLAYAVEGGVAGKRRTPAYDVLGDELRTGRGRAGRDGGAIRVDGTVDNAVDGLHGAPIRFVPFATVGADGSPYRVWIATEPPRIARSVLAGGTETRSHGTIDHGSIVDDEPWSFATTYDGADHDEDWFAVEVASPVTFRRVVVGHGWSWVNGGWFDAATVPPRIEIRPSAGAPWQRLGDLPGYPATTARDPAGLVGGESFDMVLGARVAAVAVRVIGRGSHGDYPPARYATCSKLEAYDR